jgi:hypothetical protein
MGGVPNASLSWIQRAGVAVSSLTVVTLNLADLLIRPALVPDNIRFLAATGLLAGVLGIAIALRSRSTVTWRVAVTAFALGVAGIMWGQGHWIAPINGSPATIVLHGALPDDPNELQNVEAYIYKKYPTPTVELAALLQDWPRRVRGREHFLVQQIGADHRFVLSHRAIERTLAYASFHAIMMCAFPLAFLIKLKG